MSQKTIIIIAVAAVAGILVVAAIGYYWINLKKTGIDGLNTAEDITSSATKGLLPSISTNPLEDKPDLNPVDKANPYANIKINPF